MINIPIMFCPLTANLPSSAYPSAVFFPFSTPFTCRSKCFTSHLFKKILLMDGDILGKKQNIKKDAYIHLLNFDYIRSVI